MTTPREIYTAYKIMPNLQLHQLRVAAVGKFIAQDASYELDMNSIVLAGLFHDMGNIIKSDFSIFPEFCEPQGVAYWEEVKAHFTVKYGTKTHYANIKIAQDLKLPQRVIDIIDAVGFSNIKNVSDSDMWEEKIVEYSDCRVGPRGVLPLRERSEEGRTRYLARNQQGDEYTDELFELLFQEAVGLESQLFIMSKITPADITDDVIAPIIEQLWDYQINL